MRHSGHDTGSGWDVGKRRSSRRQFLRWALAGTAGAYALAGRGRLFALEEGAALPPDLRAIPDRSATAPATPVSIERCASYEPRVLAERLTALLDRVGGLKPLVGGKTVTVKLNITGDGRQRMAGLPSERTYQTHPAMVEVLCGVLRRAGARRIYLVESFYRNRPPEEILARHGWDIERIRSAGDHKVFFEDTRHRGAFDDYAVLKVPYGGYVFPSYHLNRRYEDTDVLISLAKLKNHVTAGITCSVKNLFGIAPTSLYGNDAPNEKTTQNRGDILHYGSRDVPSGVAAERFHLPPEIAARPRNEIACYRVPRVTADLLAVRPIDLAVVDGVEAVAGGEGPWCPPPHRHTTPNLLIAGANAVTTDAVCVGVMGYDPEAEYGHTPFPGANHLRLLARAGIGSNDLGRIEVRGVSLDAALYEYEPDRAEPGWVKRHRKA